MEFSVLKIADTPNGFAIDIEDLQPLLPPAADGLRWGVADAHERYEVLLDDHGTVSRRPRNFTEMKVLWSAVHQTIWGTYVAARDDATLATFPGEYLDRIRPATLARFPFLLQAVDSSFWLVHSTHPEFLAAVEARFTAVTRMPYALR
jgi:hypothetical protein